MTGATAFWPYLVLVVVGFLPSEIWRWFAVLFARNIRDDSEVLLLVRAVATALLAGVVAKLLLTPPGQLAAVPLAGRLFAFSLGCAAFFGLRRSILAAIAVGETVLVALAWWYSS